MGSSKPVAEKVAEEVVSAVADEIHIQNAGEVVATNTPLVAAPDGDGFDWEDDAGAGLEGADSETFAIPFIRVIQKMSPQVDEHSSDYIEGAKAGMFFNTVSGRLYDGKAGIDFMPVFYQRRYLRWGARGADGASFKGEYMPSDVDKMIADGEIKEIEGRLYVPLPDGSIDDKKCDRFSDTRSHFIILIEPDGSLSQGLMTLTSTQIKKSKKLMSMLKGVVIGGKNPPTYKSRIHATTAIESNDQGSWSGVRFEANGILDDKIDRALLEAGRDFNKALRAGQIKADYAKAEGESESQGDGF